MAQEELTMFDLTRLKELEDRLMPSAPIVRSGPNAFTNLTGPNGGPIEVPRDALGRIKRNLITDPKQFSRYLPYALDIESGISPAGLSGKGVMDTVNTLQTLGVLSKIAQGKSEDTQRAIFSQFFPDMGGATKIEREVETAREKARAIKQVEKETQKVIPSGLFRAIGQPDFLDKLAQSSDAIDSDDALKLLAAHRQTTASQKDRNDEPAMLRAGLKAVENIKLLHNKRFTGPLGGRIGGLQSFTGAISEEEADFRAALGQLELETKKALIGTAQSKQEIESFRKAFPSVNNSDRQFLSNIKQTRLNLQRKLSELEAARGGSLSEEVGKKDYSKMSNEELLRELGK